jgi:hypothetical protein
MTVLAIGYLGLDEARSLTDKIKAHVSELLPLIKEAFERRADVALGYANWLDYCDTELRGLRLPVERRREAVTELREAGMSTRAIGAALGVSKDTVQRELSQVETVAQPGRVVSLDGRERPATQPKTAATAVRPVADGSGAAEKASDGPTAEAAAVTPTASAGNTEPSPVQQFIDADPEVQAVRYRKRFFERLSAVGPVVETDAERIGPLLEPGELELLEQYAASLAAFVEKVHAARRGLRVIKGGQQ